MICIDEGLMLGILTFLSLHGGTLTLIDWFDSKLFLVPTKTIGRMFLTNFCDTNHLFLIVVSLIIFDRYFSSFIDEVT